MRRQLLAAKKYQFLTRSGSGPKVQVFNARSRFQNVGFFNRCEPHLLLALFAGVWRNGNATSERDPFAPTCWFLHIAALARWDKRRELGLLTPFPNMRVQLRGEQTAHTYVKGIYRQSGTSSSSWRRDFEPLIAICEGDVRLHSLFAFAYLAVCPALLDQPDACVRLCSLFFLRQPSEKTALRTIERSVIVNGEHGLISLANEGDCFTTFGIAAGSRDRSG